MSLSLALFLSFSLSLSFSAPLPSPFTAHNSWPDFSPLLAVVGLSLMTIHREGIPLVKIKIRPEALVNRVAARSLSSTHAGHIAR